MANAMLSATEYAKSGLVVVVNNLVMAKLVNTKFQDGVNDENSQTVLVKRPPRFVQNDASALNAAFAAQDLVIGSVPVTVDQYAKAHFTIGDIEHCRTWNQLVQDMTFKARMISMAHQIDSFLIAKTKLFSSYVGHATTMTNNIGSAAEFMPVHTRLMNLGVPDNDLVATLLYEDGEEIRAGLLTGNIDDVNRTALEKAQIPMLSNIKAYATQQCPSITTGTRAGTTLIDNGTLSVNYRDVKTTMVQTIHVDGLSGATQTLKAGEILTIADVYAWDWRRNAILPYLQQFVVQADVTASGSEFDVIVSPPLIVQGTSDGVSTDANTAFATVNAAAVDGAAVTFLGAASTTYRVRAAWHKSAITLVTARLAKPFSGESDFVVDPKTNIGIRYWRDSDAATGAHMHRFDCFYGGANLNPLMGSRVSGT